MTTIEIPAKGYAVLYRSGRDIVADPSAVKVPLDNFPSALANTGKLLQLFDGDKNLIDEVTYEKATPAKSWQRSSSNRESLFLTNFFPTLLPVVANISSYITVPIVPCRYPAYRSRSGKPMEH